jgi:hypothetical protein
MKTRITKRYIKNFEVTFDSDVYEGQIMDTKVIINEQTLFCIAGNEIPEFLIDFSTLVNKYAI